MPTLGQGDSGETEWEWDPFRKKQFWRWDEGQCFVYDDGEQVPYSTSASASDVRSKPQTKISQWKNTYQPHDITPLGSPREPPKWEWDFGRQQCFFRSNEIQCFIYEDGERVPYSSHTASSSEVRSGYPSHPQADDHGFGQGFSYAGPSTQESVFATPSSGLENEPEDASKLIEHGLISRGLVKGAAKDLTDPTLYKKRIFATSKLNGTRGYEERLDPRYRKRSSKEAMKYFRVGKES
ncbi:hypothetical protein K402DRAFT_20847 [Aulographum hederae CBS 113979]|uniref:Uncharacterized protein n=1 Tax=Aulographum hederae CBS 113979 TaxID=1176131 RepID=A0A6G1H6Z2_9PEZI|nr:hypothetical protein K402DRAFT_20847 [Aulographum hederae CBS 113979]